MSGVLVVDNLIVDQEIINALYNYFMYMCPHRLHEVSADTEHDKNTKVRFYSTDFDLSNNTIKQLYESICIKLNISFDAYEVLRVNTNIQYVGMGIDSVYHEDPGDLTFVYFLSDDVEGGEFEYVDGNGKINKVQYMQDRLIAFDARTLHKALPPSNTSARLSIAFKTKKI